MKHVKRWLGIGAIAVAAGVGVLIFADKPPKPTRLLCPIAPSSVSEPNCELYVGQTYGEHLYEIVPAVELKQNEIGLYKNYENELVVFEDVGFHPYPAEHTVVYTQELLLYKTERQPTDQTKCPAHLTQHGLCDTPVDRVSFSDGIEGELDLAIAFTIKATPDNLAELHAIGGPRRFIEVFKQVVRGNRQLASIDVKVANTEAGAQQIAQSFRQALDEWALSHLLEVQTISIRSVLVGSELYRQQAETQISELAQQAFDEKRLVFERQQRLEDAKSFAASVQTICQDTQLEDCTERVWTLLNEQRGPSLFNQQKAPAAVPQSQ